MTLFESNEHNVKCSHIRFIWTLILLLNTFCHEWSRLVRLFNELLYITSFDLHIFSMTLFDAREHNLSVSHIHFTWILFLQMNKFWHDWSRLVTPCNELLYIISFDVYTVSKSFFDATWHNLSFSRSIHLDSIFTVEHILTRMITHFNAL
jgi:hypothetical protein